MNPFSFFNQKKTTGKRSLSIPPPDVLSGMLSDLGSALDDSKIIASEETKILDDPVVFAARRSRKSAILKKEIQIETENEELKNQLEKIFTFRVLQTFLNTPYYGLNVCEINWKNEGGIWFPEIVERDRRNFLIKAGSLYYLEGGSEVSVPKNKAVWEIFEPSYNKPSGDALINKLYFLVKMTGINLRLWERFFEKFAVPWIVGKTSGDLDEMAEELFQFVSGSVASIDVEDNIEVITPNSGKTEIQNLIDYLDNRKRELILGGNLMGEIKGGSFAAAKTQSDVREEITLADLPILKSMCRQTIDAFLSVNSIDAEISIRFKDEDDPGKEWADRDAVIAGMGYKPTKKYLEGKYKIELEEPQATQNPGSFAGSRSADDQNLLLFKNSKPADETEKQSRELDTEKYETTILKVVNRVLNGAKSYEEAQEKLLELYEMDLADIEEVLEKYLVNAEIYGSAKVEDENPEG